jgi:predicted nucleotidyltransferase component of viral defense system
MIPQAYITEWQNFAPWQRDSQIEQDLILCRILTEIFNNNLLHKKLLFRGGTAIYKLFFQKPLRYSEDLDFVQKVSGPIKEISREIQKTIGPWLGKSSTSTRRDGFRVYFQFQSESDPLLSQKIKIEINTREHFNVFPIQELPFEVQSKWIRQSCNIPTYQIDELTGTKLRALYQRKKGRDLFDIYMLLEEGLINEERVITSFKEYISRQGVSISQNQFLSNLEEKLSDDVFIHDVDVFILPEIDYNPVQAGESIIRLLNYL